MTGYEMMKKFREEKLEKSIKELEILADKYSGSSHYLSEESFKLGLEFAIREIEGTEKLMFKAHQELPYSDPENAEREHKNTMNLLMVMKSRLISRYKGKP